MMAERGIMNCLSIDVEDYFQVSAFEDVSPRPSWDTYEVRVEANTDRILQCLEDADVRGTFFILGWVAERFPGVVRRIAAQGNEVASHGYNHQRLPQLTRQEFREEIRRSKALLEDLGGQRVLGYRAPSYSIQSGTLWAFDELLEAGYRYDSSVFPVPHDFYGMAHWPDHPVALVRQGEADWVPGERFDLQGQGLPPQSEFLVEIPIATLDWLGRRWPIAGGGYFRLYPYAVTRWGLRRINRQEGKPFVFYLHPWELDPEQPRMRGACLKSRFRHYLNLRRTEGRFRQLLQDFSFLPIRDFLFPDGTESERCVSLSEAQPEPG